MLSLDTKITAQRNVSRSNSRKAIDSRSTGEHICVTDTEGFFRRLRKQGEEGHGGKDQTSAMVHIEKGDSNFGQLTLNPSCSSAPNCREKHGPTESVDYTQEKSTTAHQ